MNKELPFFFFILVFGVSAMEKSLVEITKKGYELSYILTVNRKEESTWKLEDLKAVAKEIKEKTENRKVYSLNLFSTFNPLHFGEMPNNISDAAKSYLLGELMVCISKVDASFLFLSCNEDRNTVLDTLTTSISESLKSISSYSPEGSQQIDQLSSLIEQQQIILEHNEELLVLIKLQKEKMEERKKKIEILKNLSSPEILLRSRLIAEMQQLNKSMQEEKEEGLDNQLDLRMQHLNLSMEDMSLAGIDDKEEKDELIKQERRRVQEENSGQKQQQSIKQPIWGRLFNWFRLRPQAIRAFIGRLLGRLAFLKK